MTGYLVRERCGSYLEWVPADKRFEWLAGSSAFASVLTLAAATTLAQRFAADGATVHLDHDRRVPQFGLGDVERVHAA